MDEQELLSSASTDASTACDAANAARLPPTTCVDSVASSASNDPDGVHLVCKSASKRLRRKGSSAAGFSPVAAHSAR